MASLYPAKRRTAEVGPVLVLQLEPLAKKVAELLEPHIERLGFELVVVEFHKGTRHHALLRLLVDKPGGGISLSDLERLSPILGDLLDVYDPVEGRYTLEVSSPGINRPLAKLKDFEAYRGQRVRIRTHRPREGRKNFEGVLIEVRPDGVALEDELSRERHAFAFNEIQGANYEHKFD
ncbi:MAG: ribosome maturation factor RimP [Deltaproteobacteria bacterium]|nr:ribosome maturation factor RimP [Deltaproteobacteria bacterium]